MAESGRPHEADACGWFDKSVSDFVEGHARERWVPNFLHYQINEP